MDPADELVLRIICSRSDVTAQGTSTTYRLCRSHSWSPTFFVLQVSLQEIKTCHG